ncbi:MAG: 30S ribosomal protein S5 [Candidatus Woesearchaeota archaeon]
MSEEVKEEEPVIAPDDEEKVEKELPKSTIDKEAWKPKTSLGMKVKAGEITHIDQILDNGLKIMEPEIVDILVLNLEQDLLLVGQSKGKFGGGKRRIFRQTQKKTPEGNKPKFGTFAIVGNRDGYVGIGVGKAKETVPAREKALRNAKTHLFKIRRGCGSWECGCKTAHSIPFAVKGKSGSVEITFMPAPKGSGLVAEKECQKILGLAGIKDIYSRASGQTRTRINLISACIDALRQLMETKVQSKYTPQLGIVEGVKNE